MKIAVSGGRDNYDYEFIDAVLHSYSTSYQITEILVGDASGVDSIVKQWCRYNEMECKVFEANWKEYGKSAGPIRNSEILNDHPDIVILFAGGAGTENMSTQAASRRIVTVDYRDRGENG
jgi:hypothetical protein